MTRPDHIDNNTMKHHSQSSELTGSLAASESAVLHEESLTTPPPARDFMYNWIREKSGRVKSN
jgi:hypothetical protein